MNIKNEINQDRSYENFQNHDCDCDDKPPEKKKYIKKCRIICDDNEEETIFKNLKIQEFNEEQKHSTIKIMDVLGKEVKRIDFSGKQLTIEKGEMKEGIYFLQITDENKNVMNEKIVVQ